MSSLSEHALGGRNEAREAQDATLEGTQAASFCLGGVVLSSIFNIP